MNNTFAQSPFAPTSINEATNTNYSTTTNSYGGNASSPSYPSTSYQAPSTSGHHGLNDMGSQFTSTSLNTYNGQPNAPRGSTTKTATIITRKISQGEYHHYAPKSYEETSPAGSHFAPVTSRMYSSGVNFTRQYSNQNHDGLTTTTHSDGPTTTHSNHSRPYESQTTKPTPHYNQTSHHLNSTRGLSLGQSYSYNNQSSNDRSSHVPTQASNYHQTTRSMSQTAMYDSKSAYEPQISHQTSGPAANRTTRYSFVQSEKRNEENNNASNLQPSNQQASSHQASNQQASSHQASNQQASSHQASSHQAPSVQASINPVASSSLANSSAPGQSGHSFSVYDSKTGSTKTTTVLSRKVVGTAANDNMKVYTRDKNGKLTNPQLIPASAPQSKLWGLNVGTHRSAGGWAVIPSTVPVPTKPIYEHLEHLGGWMFKAHGLKGASLRDQPEKLLIDQQFAVNVQQAMKGFTNILEHLESITKNPNFKRNLFIARHKEYPGGRVPEKPSRENLTMRFVVDNEPDKTGELIHDPLKPVIMNPLKNQYKEIPLPGEGSAGKVRHWSLPYDLAIATIEGRNPSKNRHPSFSTSDIRGHQVTSRGSGAAHRKRTNNHGFVVNDDDRTRTARVNQSMKPDDVRRKTTMYCSDYAESPLNPNTKYTGSSNNNNYYS